LAKSKELAKYVHSDYPNTKITLGWVILKGMTDTESELKLLSEFALELGIVVKKLEEN